MVAGHKAMEWVHGLGQTDLYPSAISATSQGGETIIDPVVLHHQEDIVAVMNTEVGEIEALIVIMADEVDQDLHLAELLDTGVPVHEHVRLT